MKERASMGLERYNNIMQGCWALHFRRRYRKNLSVTLFVQKANAGIRQDHKTNVSVRVITDHIVP